MLYLREVKKFYNAHLVMQASFLQLESGIYWVKGANGSGKTTLLKMVAGLIPFQGDILVQQISLKKNPLLYRRHISWAEAEPVFPGFMKGMDLINLYQNIRKSPQQELTGLLELFNMAEWVGNPISTYSAGMTKKLSLLLAFLGNPSLIILDEPLITLDPDSFSFVCDYILHRHKKSGTSFLMSSHQDLDTNLALSGRELLIHHQTVVLK